MAKFYPLFSSSSANSHYIGGRNAGILVDAGASCKRTVQAMERNGLSVQAIQGIFITHTHSDHTKGLRVLLGKIHVPVYGTADTLEMLAHDGIVPEGTVLIPMEKGAVECAGCEISAFLTQHDAQGSCGYRIHTEDGKYCAVCTDLGTVTPAVWNGICGCDMVLIESNYDADMLRYGPYPAELKRRIRSDFGHLSNDDSAKAVRELVRNGTTRILLGHLSPHNNTPELAARTVLDALSEFRHGMDYVLGIAPVETDGGVVIF